MIVTLILKMDFENLSELILQSDDDIDILRSRFLTLSSDVKVKPVTYNFFKSSCVFYYLVIYFLRSTLIFNWPLKLRLTLNSACFCEVYPLIS